jgi:hypothetical protein
MTKKRKLPHPVKKKARVIAHPAPVAIPDVLEPVASPPLQPYVPPLKMSIDHEATSRKRGWVIAAIVASGIFVLAVGYLAYINTPAPEPAPVPVVMVTATATPTPTDTATPTPTDTGTPLATPTAVATPSPHHHHHYHYDALLKCVGGASSGPDKCTETGE